MCFIFQIIELWNLSHKQNQQFGLKPPSDISKSHYSIKTKNNF